MNMLYSHNHYVHKRVDDKTDLFILQLKKERRKEKRRPTSNKSFFF